MGQESCRRAVVGLAHRCGYEAGHSLQVSRLALAIFDELREVHGFGQEERDLLEYGGILHDIGFMEGQKGHHKTACRVILEDESVPFGKRQRLIAASLARYHRKRGPREGDWAYDQLDEGDRRVVCVLGGILRVADGLDRAHRNQIESVRCDVLEEGVVFHCQSRGPSDSEQWAAEKKSDLLEKALGCKIRIVIDNE